MNQGDSFSPGNALHDIDILCVDGEAYRRHLMRRMLVSFGARNVVIAVSAEEALVLFAQMTPGLVITERCMTPLDGIALIRQMRSAKNYPKALVPAIVLSDSASSEVVAAAFEAGANHFIVRPVSRAQLYARIERTLQDTRGFAVKDGRYVLKPPARPATAPKEAMTK